MATHIMNSQGSTTVTTPSTLQVGDVLTFNYTNALNLSWTLPYRTTFRIKAYGAPGGYAAGSSDTYGKIITGDMNISRNSVLSFLIYNGGVGGGTGGSGAVAVSARGNSGAAGYAGGGGTRVLINGVEYIIAGGGIGVGGAGGAGYMNKNSKTGLGGGYQYSAGTNGLSSYYYYNTTGPAIWDTGGSAGTGLSGGNGGRGYNYATQATAGGSAPNIYCGAGGGGGGPGYREGTTQALSSYSTGGSGGGTGQATSYFTHANLSNVVVDVGSIYYGYVEMTILSIDLDKYLIIDGSDIKKYQSSTWTTLGTGTPTESMFTDSTMTVNDAITNRAGLTSSNPVILRWDPIKTSIAITEGRYVVPKLIPQNYDIDLRSVDNIDSFTITASQTGGGLVKAIVSFDSGVTWKSWSGTEWVVVDTNSMATVKSLAMTVTAFNALTHTEWVEALVVGSIRFAFYIEVVSYSDTASIDALNSQFDMKGGWWSTDDTIATYEYVDNNAIKLTIKASGDYKINY